MFSSLRLFALLACVLALTACAGVKESVGLGRVTPDEFAVVDRPPLAIPPDYTLEPPRPGAPRPQDVDMKERARVALLGETPAFQVNFARQEPQASALEQALLAKAGTDQAESNIRAKIDSEANDMVTGSKHLIDDLLFWKSKQPAGAVVDAAAEKQRLDVSKQEGTSPTETATPIIERKKSSLLGL